MLGNKNGKVSNNVKLVLHGDFDLLLANFIKTFQYPNPKQVNKISKNVRPYLKPYLNGNQKGLSVYKYQVNHHYKIAPLRYLIQLLYFKKIYLDDNSVSVSFFKNNILANANICNTDFSVKNIILNVLNKRGINNIQSNAYANNVKILGCGSDINTKSASNSHKRFVKTLLDLINQLDFINITNGNIYLNICNEKDAYLLNDIISYNHFWDPNSKEKYKQYIQYKNVNNDQNERGKFNLKGKIKFPGKNIILYGAPGVGKSYRVRDIIRNNGLPKYGERNYETDNVLHITLYPDYDYTDFVGQIMPSMNGNSIVYKEHAGIFTEALKRAYSDLSKPVFLVLEEMSRCNIAAVFGDMFQLLDRNEYGESIYGVNNELISKKLFNGNKYHSIKIPSNLFIIGTLNISDQSVYPMDTAFKRRFEWLYISIDEAPHQLIKFHTKEFGPIAWYTLRHRINDYIVNVMHFNEDKQIGEFFIKFPAPVYDGKNSEDTVCIDSNCKEPLKSNIVHLMRDKLLFYLWNDIDKVYLSLNSGANSLKKTLLKSNMSFSQLYSNYDPLNDLLSVFSTAFINKYFSK